MTTPVFAERRLSNYLRIHRKNAGLSQQEVGRILGYTHVGPVSRHEHFLDVPSLQIAIGYEIVFRIPVSELFAGMRDEIEEEVEHRLEGLESALGKRSTRDRDALAIAKKLMWLEERKDIESASLA